MVYTFFVLTAILCILSFFLCKKDILSPFFVTCAVFAASAGVFALNYKRWGMPFHANTMLTIILGILMFGLGTLIALYRPKKVDGHIQLQRYDYQSHSDYLNIEVSVSPFYTISASILIFLTDIWYFYDSYRISLIAGNHSGIARMLTYVRNITMYTTKDVGTPFILKQLKYFCFPLALIFLFTIIYDIVYKKRKTKISYIIPLLLYIPQMILTTGRLVFFKTIIFSFVIYIILYQRRNGWDSKAVLKFISYILVGAAAFIVIFRLFGYLVGKTRFSLYDNVCLYLGGSLPAFDSFLNTHHVTNTSFGAETFVNLQRLFYKLGISKSYHISSLEWIKILGMGINTYTSLRRYIHDFGYAGMVAIQFLLGLFYTWFYIYTSRKEKGLLGIFIIGIIFYPIVLQFFDELFFVSIGSTQTICQIIYAIFIYWWLVGRKNHEFKYIDKCYDFIRSKSGELFGVKRYVK